MAEPNSSFGRSQLMSAFHSLFAVNERYSDLSSIVLIHCAAKVRSEAKVC